MNTDCALIWILVLAQILICMGRMVVAAVGWVGMAGKSVAVHGCAAEEPR